MSEQTPRTKQLTATREIERQESGYGKEWSGRRESGAYVTLARALRFFLAIGLVAALIIGGITAYNDQVLNGALRHATVSVGSAQYRLHSISWSWLNRLATSWSSQLPGPAADGWIVSIYRASDDPKDFMRCFASVEAEGDLDMLDRVVSGTRLTLTSRHGPFASQFEAVMGLEQAGWEKFNLSGLIGGFVARSGC